MRQIVGISASDGLFGESSVHNSPHTMAMWRGHNESLDRQYRVCCCHIRTCASFVGIMEIVGLVFLLTGLAMFGPTQEGYRGDQLFKGIFIAAAIYETVWAAGVAVMFYGIHKESPVLLIPHLVLQAGGIGCFLAFAGSLVMTAKEGTNYIAPAVTVMTRAIVEIFFFYVVMRCLNYFAQKQASTRTDTVTVPMFPYLPDPPAYSDSMAYAAPVDIEPLPRELPLPQYDHVSTSRDRSSPPPPYSPLTTPAYAVTKL